MKTVVIVSGGLDSVTLAYHLAQKGHKLDILSFSYGQRHVKELSFARVCAERLGVNFDLVDLSSVGRLLTGSALTDPTLAMPEGHYAAPNMRLTVVPNRNAIMLAVAFGVAVARNAEAVATAVHAGDHFIYPDCRPEFISAFDAMQRLAVAGFGSPNLHLDAPFVNISKADIVSIGDACGVPFTDTWSCYSGRDVHCGKCGTCVERKEAFLLAGIFDPTVYADGVS